MGQTRFLDLPDELLRIILGKLIDAAGDDKAISCIRARLTSLLVCKDFKRLALEIPLSLYSEEALYDAQVRCALLYLIYLKLHVLIRVHHIMPTGALP